MKRFGTLLLAGACGGAAVWLGQSGRFTLTPTGMSFEQLAASLLAASALIITVFGVFIAILALWGYREFQRVAEEKAKDSAIHKIETELQEGEIRLHIEQIITNFLEEGIRNGSLSGLLESRREEGKIISSVDGDDNSASSVDSGWGELSDGQS